MDTILTTPPMVVEDRDRHLFRVARRAFTDDGVLEAERRAIFDRCWLYLGHSSEIAGNCDFITRAVGGRELIFNRDRGGAVHAFLNTCPHRGAMVVREKKGNAALRTSFEVNSDKRSMSWARGMARVASRTR